MKLEKMRTDADARVRREAACADRAAGRDLAWARTDADAYVRLEEARNLLLKTKGAFHSPDVQRAREILDGILSG